MAKTTFYSLSEEKKKSILNALKVEFESHSLNEASVADIIKLADIPRGSFYQYFDDLEDSFFTILENEISESHEIFAKILKENNGDLYKALESFGSAMADEIFSKYKMYRMRYLNWNQTLAGKWKEFRKKRNEEVRKENGASTSIQSSFFKGLETEKMGYINTVIHSIIEKLFVMDWDKEEFLKHYKQYIDWMINGIKIKEEK